MALSQGQNKGTPPTPRESREGPGAAKYEAHFWRCESSNHGVTGSHIRVKGAEPVKDSSPLGNADPCRWGSKITSRRTRPTPVPSNNSRRSTCCRAAQQELGARAHLNLEQ